MIGYVTIGTNDLERAVAFYDELLAELGASRMMEEPGTFVAWAVTPDKPAISVTRPYDGKAATAGNGMMVALAVETPEQVQRVYEKALALGGRDEGAAGPRMAGFYAGYFRDLDGNKLNVFCFNPDAA
ncbi:MAG: VOC family protein [Xanthomonadales bacterium]|nr:VOC family protein [Gammaproteobacteria bacterium]NNK37554.1 VOC family protein [Xanthomonadales bacterium]